MNAKKKQFDPTLSHPIAAFDKEGNAIIVTRPSIVEAQIENLFVIADNAKKIKDYRTANLLFAYLATKEEFASHLTFQVERGWTRPDLWEDGDGDYFHFEEYNFYNLLSVRYAGHYLCIPVPLLTISAYNAFFRKAVIVEKGVHQRVFVDEKAARAAGFRPIDTSNIHLYVPDLEEPKGFFQRPLGYVNWDKRPWRTDRAPKRIRPLFMYITK